MGTKHSRKKSILIAIGSYGIRTTWHFEAPKRLAMPGTAAADSIDQNINIDSYKPIHIKNFKPFWLKNHPIPLALALHSAHACRRPSRPRAMPPVRPAQYLRHRGRAAARKLLVHAHARLARGPGATAQRAARRRLPLSRMCPPGTRARPERRGPADMICPSRDACAQQRHCGEARPLRSQARARLRARRPARAGGQKTLFL